MVVMINDFRSAENERVAGIGDSDEVDGVAAFIYAGTDAVGAGGEAFGAEAGER